MTERNYTRGVNVQRVFVGICLIILSSLAQAADIKISCGVAPYENVFKKVKDGFESSSGHKIILVGEMDKNGADVSFNRVFKGEVDVGSAGISWEDWKKIMKDKGVADADLSKIAFKVVGNDIMKVVAHSGNSLKELTKPQLEDVFTGKVTDWKDVGGTAGPIKVILQKTYPATNNFFKKAGIGNKDFTKDAKMEDSVATMMKAIASTAGAVGFVSAQQYLSSVKELETQGLTIGRPITALTVGKPSQAVMDLFGYISKQKL